MSNRVRVLAALAALTLLAGGCLRGSDPDEGSAGEGEIVWALPPGDATVHQGTADRWNEEHPDNPVRIELLPTEADGQRQQFFLELSAQGKAFDVMGIDVIWTGEFVENGWLAPLDDVRDEVEEVTLRSALESGLWEDQLWAIPYNTNAGLLYYRKDLVDQPPETWEELAEVGKRVGEQEGMSPFVGQGAKYEGMVVNYLEYLWGAGGDIYSDDYLEVAFAQDDAAATALEFMQTAFSDGVYAAGFNTFREDEARLTFSDGNAVFMRNWPFAYGLLSDPDEGSKVVDKFGVAPLPTFSEEPGISSLGGVNNAVNAFSDNQEVAKEFAVFAATDRDAQLNLFENALPPTMADIYENEGQDDPMFSVLGEVLPLAKPRPPVPEYNSVSVAIQEQIFPAYNAGLPPDESVGAVRQEAEKLLEERLAAEEIRDQQEQQ